MASFHGYIVENLKERNNLLDILIIYVFRMIHHLGHPFLFQGYIRHECGFC